MKKSEDQNLKLSIVDNGIGRDQAEFQSATIPHRSLATKITRERLRLLNEKWVSGFDMKISDIINNKMVTGTKVTFNLPILELE